MLVIFWIPWLIGTVAAEILLVITIRRIDELWDENCLEDEEICLNQLDNKTQILFYTYKIIKSILVFGIIVAQFSGIFYKETFLAKMVISIYPAIIVHFVLVQNIVEGKVQIEKRIQICFVIISILSIGIWTTLISNYYQKNVEEVEQKCIEQIEKRELLYLCDIPVTGEISSGETELGDFLPYKYVDKYNNIQEDTAFTHCSISRPIKEGEVPYVEITSYYYYKAYEDYYTGIYWFSREHRWKEYIFYLPHNLSLQIN